MANNHLTKCSIFQVSRNSNQNAHEISPHTTEDVTDSRYWEQQGLWDVVQQELPSSLYSKQQATRRYFFSLPQKSKNGAPIWPRYPTSSDLFAKHKSIHSKRYICTPLFISTLGTTARKWKQPKYPTTRDALWYKNTVKHCTASRIKIKPCSSRQFRWNWRASCWVK